MSERRNDTAENWPALGRLMSWVDRPGNPKKIIWMLAAACAIVFALDFTYEKHGYFQWEHLPGFFAIFGFVGFTGLILLAKLLRKLIMRPEDYYAPKSVDAEEYPPSGLEKVEHDG